MPQNENQEDQISVAVAVVVAVAVAVVVAVVVGVRVGVAVVVVVGVVVGVGVGVGVAVGFDAPGIPADGQRAAGGQDGESMTFREETIGGGHLLAPFPYFGGKRTIASSVWERLGAPKQYIEPFCGSLAILLAAPRPASLEVVNDGSGFIANFWRAVKHQPAAVAGWADYPVSHIDLGARHQWLMRQRDRIGAELQDPDWPGDAKIAGWWLWGQCCWIGSGWCDWFGKIPQASDAGMGVQAIGKIPHAGNAGRGVQAIGKIPHAGNAGRGVQAIGKIPQASDAGMLTSCGQTALQWLRVIAYRIERVRVVHGDWTRCLNHHYGGDNTAVFLDPPYRSFEAVYSSEAPVVDKVCSWARDNANLRIALCGHVGDYSLPGWDAVQWTRGRPTYGGDKTMNLECVWYSPACHKPGDERQGKLL